VPRAFWTFSSFSIRRFSRFSAAVDMIIIASLKQKHWQEFHLSTGFFNSSLTELFFSTILRGTIRALLKSNTLNKEKRNSLKGSSNGHPKTKNGWIGFRIYKPTESSDPDSFLLWNRDFLEIKGNRPNLTTRLAFSNSSRSNNRTIRTLAYD